MADHFVGGKDIGLLHRLLKPGLRRARGLPKVTHRPLALPVVQGLLKGGIHVRVVGQLPSRARLAQQPDALPGHGVGELGLYPLCGRLALALSAVNGEEAPHVGGAHLRATHTCAQLP